MAWMPNGAKSCGMFGSVKPPCVFTGWNVFEKTSTALLPKSAANSRGPCPCTRARASPLKIAPGVVHSVAAVVVPGAQAAIEPVSVSRMKSDGVGVPPTSCVNPIVPLNTWPVGSWAGTVTTSGAIEIGMPPAAPG